MERTALQIFLVLVVVGCMAIALGIVMFALEYKGHERFFRFLWPAGLLWLVGACVVAIYALALLGSTIH